MSKWHSLPASSARASAARGAAPHISSCRYSGFSPTISGCVSRPDEMNASMASLVGSRISACGSNGLASRQCFSVGRPFFCATSISRSQAAFSASAYQRSVSRLVDRALHVIAERARPVHRELRAQLVPDIAPCSRTRNAAYSRTSGASAAGLAAHTA